MTSRATEPLRMYRFRYSTDGGERWVRTRYRLQAPEVRCRFPDHELLDCEIRRGPDDPYRLGAGVVGAAFVPPPSKPAPPANVAFDPELHERELKCARIFLQRYATWCVRKKRFASAGGAAHLSRRLRDKARRGTPIAVR
jgi:hypothetical protein